MRGLFKTTFRLQTSNMFEKVDPLLLKGLIEGALSEDIVKSCSGFGIENMPDLAGGVDKVLKGQLIVGIPLVVKDIKDILNAAGTCTASAGDTLKDAIAALGEAIQ